LAISFLVDQTGKTLRWAIGRSQRCHRACELTISGHIQKRLTREATMSFVSQTANAATAGVAEGFTNSPDVLSQAHIENRVSRSGKPAGAIFICDDGGVS
jgi:hypothetical protein